MDTRTVLIIGFQGTGARREYVIEPTLIKLGHVGLSLDNGRTIYSFRPTAEAVASFMRDTQTTEKDLIRFLQNGGVLQGSIYNDTEIFQRAAALAKAGARTQAWQVPISVNDEGFTKIKEAVLTQSQNGSPFPAWYGFPQEPSRPCHNCATYLRTFDERLAVEQTGILEIYIAQMREIGSQWSGEV